MQEYEKAITFYEEALHIRRRLADEKPDVYLPDLAKSLFSMACCLENMKNYDEAINIIGESTCIFRELEKKDSDKYSEKLCSSLKEMADILFKLGRNEEAEKIKSEVEKLQNLSLNSPIII